MTDSKKMANLPSTTKTNFIKVKKKFKSSFYLKLQGIKSPREITMIWEAFY